MACVGIETETVRDRASEVLDSIPNTLARWGFDCAPLDLLRRRLATGRLPADDIVAIFEREKTLERTLGQLCSLH